MEYPEPYFLVDERQVGGQGFRAVQGDTAITCADWQGFHSWQDGDPAFTGIVTVLDDHGWRQTIANWSSPTDAAADTSLGHTGWQRVGPWNSDNNGPCLTFETSRRHPLRISARPSGIQAWLGMAGGSGLRPNRAGLAW